MKTEVRMYNPVHGMYPMCYELYEIFTLKFTAHIYIIIYITNPRHTYS